MAAEPTPEKSLEMRVAELEDKLAQVNITEDEMKAYRKVAGLLGQGAAAAIPPGGAAASCVVDCSGCLTECTIRACTVISQCTVIRQCTIVRQCTVITQPIVRQCTIISQCIRECWAECAPGLPGGPIGGGGIPGEQFGTLGA